MTTKYALAFGFQLPEIRYSCLFLLTSKSHTALTVNDVTTVGANVIIKDAFNDSAQNDGTRLKNELTGITLNIHVRCIA